MCGYGDGTLVWWAWWWYCSVVVVVVVVVVVGGGGGGGGSVIGPSSICYTLLVYGVYNTIYVNECTCCCGTEERRIRLGMDG